MTLSLRLDNPFKVVAFYCERGWCKLRRTLASLFFNLMQMYRASEESSDKLSPDWD
jgi:hypothetical protein